MPSRVIARKSARAITILPGEEPYFSPRTPIPVNSENSAQVRAGIYRAELIDIVPVVNCTPEIIRGLPHQSIYAWIFRTLKSRDNVFMDNGVDEEGEPYEFVYYTGIEIGDPIASLTVHVGAILGEVPDPDVLTAVGLSRLIGSKVCIVVKHGTYAIPSLKAEFAWYGEADHLRRGAHMVDIASSLMIAPKPQGKWREEVEARERERAARARPMQTAVLRITDAED